MKPGYRIQNSITMQSFFHSTIACFNIVSENRVYFFSSGLTSVDHLSDLDKIVAIFKIKYK